MDSETRIVVDECIGPVSPAIGALRARLGVPLEACFFIGAEYPGIPDVEILGKLMDARCVLLTQDRVLHNRALASGFRSFMYDPETGLSNRRLPGVAVPDAPPPSGGELRESYTRLTDGLAKDIADAYCEFLSARSLKRYRTRRRRIRSYFGSADNIRAADLTISQRKVPRGIMGGYSLKVDSRGDVKALSPASAGYFFDKGAEDQPLLSVCWALLDILMLQLQHYPMTLYLLHPAAHERCAALIANSDLACGPVEELTALLLTSVTEPKAAPCVKGRFFESAMAKLDQLEAARKKGKPVGDELVDVRIQALASDLMLRAAAARAPCKFEWEVAWGHDYGRLGERSGGWGDLDEEIPF